MIRLKGILIVALLLLLLSSGCAGSGEEEKEECPAYLVSITAGNMTGSGIVYSMEEGWVIVLTAAHVVKDMPTARPAGADTTEWGPAAEADPGAQISFCDGTKVFCREIIVSELADLALLRIPITRLKEDQRESCQCVSVDKECFDALRAEDVCRAVGFGPEEKVLQYEGTILDPWIYMEDYGQYMIWAGVEIRPGMSGGGLFDENGYLIGILSGGSEDGELAAVPYSLILQFMAMSW